MLYTTHAKVRLSINNFVTIYFVASCYRHNFEYDKLLYKLFVITLSRNMKTTRMFHLKVFIFGGKNLNIFEQVCFRNAYSNAVSQ